MSTVKFDAEKVKGYAKVKHNFSGSQQFLKQVMLKQANFELVPVDSYMREVPVYNEATQKTTDVNTQVCVIFECDGKKVTMTWEDLGAMLDSDGNSILVKTDKAEGFYASDVVPTIIVSESEVVKRDSGSFKYALKYHGNYTTWDQFLLVNVISTDKTTGNVLSTEFPKMSKAINALVQQGTKVGHKFATDADLCPNDVFSKELLDAYETANPSVDVVYPARQYKVAFKATA